jgi:putative transposase
VAHIDYVHFNPVKHGIVSDLRDWPTSSFHRHLALGIYPPSWADGTTDIAEAGERS